MEKMKNRKWAAAIAGGLLLLLAAVYLCWGMWLHGPQPVSNKLSVLPEGTRTAYHSGVMEACDFSELSSRSSLIVYGTVTEISSPIILKDFFGGVSVYTDLTVEPETVLRGSADGPIVIRLPGGLSNGVYEDYAEIPELFLDKAYLLYLYQPGMGNGLYEKGDFYYLTKMCNGAFSVASRSEKRKVNSSGFAKDEDDVLFVNSLTEPDSYTAVTSLEQMKDVQPRNAALSLRTLTELYPRFNKENPIDPDLYRSEITDAYQSNLATGFISQEEYDKLMASLDEYAAPITEEEQEALAQAESAEKQALLNRISVQ